MLDTTPDLFVQRLDPQADLPERAHEDDAGMDLRANCGGVLCPGETKAFGTGLAIELPARHAGLVLPRSGLATKFGVTVANAPGLIDPGYRGEVKVALVNHGTGNYYIYKGERIAQLLVLPFPVLNVVETDALSLSERGANGFGSTGKD